MSGGPLFDLTFAPPLVIAQTLWTLTDQDVALLVVAVLLCLWLWLLVRRRDETPKANRPTPLSLHELGRMVFQAARSRDVRTWRGLFLNGAEASARMGSRAESWLSEHGTGPLAELLDSVAESIPMGAIYVGCEPQPDGRCAIRVRQQGGDDFLVLVGRAEQVGVAWRLVGLR